MAKIVIADLDINVDALVKSTSELKAEIDRIKNAQKELAKQGDTSSNQFVQNASDLKALSNAYNQNIKAITATTQAQADQANRTDLLNIALQAEVTTISEAREANKLLTKLRNDANATTAEGIEEIRRLNNALDANNEFIKENADAYLQQKINIGNYTESIKDALNQLNPFNGGISGFISRAKEAGGVGQLLKNSLSAVKDGLASVTKEALLFIATPLGAIIAALVLAFALIKNAMNRSEEATNKITKIFSIFGGIVNKLLKALEPLGEFLINNIVKYFELVGATAQKALDIVSGALDALGFESASQAVTDFKDSMTEAIKESGKLADAEAELEKAQRKSQLTQLEYQKNAEKLRQIRDNENLTIRERIQANEDLGLVLKAQLQDELKIAELALFVANQRIKAEGSTKDTLDQQAEALTQIADIQERITGQESEQLTNRVSLQKEANDKAKELRDKRIEEEINASQQRIDLFIAEQGFAKKNSQEEYDFNKQLFDKELADIQLRYDRGKLSKLEYETEKLNLSNDFALKNIDILIAEGERELEIIKNNAQLGLDAKLQAELSYQALRLENGLINEQMYQDAILELQNEYEQKKLDKRLEDEQIERDRVAVNLENERLSRAIDFETDSEIQKQQNAIKLEQELIQAEKSGADQDLIRKKYAKLDADLTRNVEQMKRQDYANTFGQLSDLVGNQSKVGKLFALAQAGITGYQAVLNAYTTAQLSPITLLNPAYPAIQAGISGVFAGAQIAKIAGVKFEKGGIASIDGARHAQGGVPIFAGDKYIGEAEGGEGIGILRRSAFADFMNYNNSFSGGISSGGLYAGGGIITQSVKPQELNINAVVDAISNMPAPVVAVEEIQRVGTGLVKVKSMADN